MMSDGYAPNLTRNSQPTAAGGAQMLPGDALKAQVMAMVQQMGQSEEGVSISYVKRQLCARDPRLEPEVE